MGLTFEASAPGRCGIIGNPSDIYGGSVLSCSVPTRNTCRLTTDVSGELPPDTRLWDAVMKRFPLPGPVKIEWECEVPRSSGLSGSTALLASTLACVLAARNELPNPIDPIAVAELTRDIERNDAGIMCGFQDAYMITHGGTQLMNFAGKHPTQPGPNATLKPLDCDLPFLLITTGVERLSGSVHSPMAQRWLDGEAAVRSAINRISELAVPGADALMSKNYTELGRLMDENHQLVADLGGSGDAIDLLIERCKQHGAVSAKLAGAGLGGTVIALVENQDALQQALQTYGYTRFIKPANTLGLKMA